MAHKFELTDDEVAKVKTWELVQDAEWVRQKRLKDPLGGSEAYYGAIGGSLTYSFTPTSIGMIVKVKHPLGTELDLSDYDSW